MNENQIYNLPFLYFFELQKKTTKTNDSPENTKISYDTLSSIISKITKIRTPYETGLIVIS